MTVLTKTRMRPLRVMGAGECAQRTETRALVAVGIPYGFWPVVKMSDGTYRKGPFAEIVGRWSDG
jgi:hypothetical protein